MKSLFLLLCPLIICQSFTEILNCKTKDDKGNEFTLDPLKKSDFWRVRDGAASGES